jgi:hypothetical protein
MNWNIDYRNLSWRAEEILDEIHGVRHEYDQDVPDSTLTLAQIASAVMTGELGRKFKAVWEVK